MHGRKGGHVKGTGPLVHARIFVCVSLPLAWMTGVRVLYYLFVVVGVFFTLFSAYQDRPRISRSDNGGTHVAWRGRPRICCSFSAEVCSRSLALSRSFFFFAHHLDLWLFALLWLVRRHHHAEKACLFAYSCAYVNRRYRLLYGSSFLKAGELRKLRGEDTPQRTCFQTPRNEEKYRLQDLNVRAARK